MNSSGASIKKPDSLGGSRVQFSTSNYTNKNRKGAILV